MANTITKVLSSDQPEIIVDFSIKDNQLFIDLLNLSSLAATNVKVNFSPEILFKDGSADSSVLTIFRGITYFAPYKHFSVLVDQLDIFFQNNKASLFQAR